MKSFLKWLAGLFRVEVVWVDRGQGKWVRRRRFHPLTRILFLLGLLALGIVAGIDFFYTSKETKERPIVATETVAPPETEGVEPASPDIVLPAPLPIPAPPPLSAGIDVGDDEPWIRVSKGNYRLYLYRGKSVDRSFGVAVGKNTGDKQRRGDNRTPEGIFSVQSIENASAWTHDFRDGKGIIQGAYGPWFIRLKTGWQGIGIHGTHAPDSIGTMVSEGCIRMQNSDLEELKRFAVKNMKVVIEE
ncbi:MAG: L,D-transpeptidase [Synergistaceae bacterium]|jgi:lipoprotein-anchoring transpeptidase ErfK/SrfK|nr:L,D-transpeptidase [Synergistaceae bacterium]